MLGAEGGASVSPHCRGIPSACLSRHLGTGKKQTGPLVSSGVSLMTTEGPGCHQLGCFRPLKSASGFPLPGCCLELDPGQPSELWPPCPPPTDQGWVWATLQHTPRELGLGFSFNHSPLDSGAQARPVTVVGRGPWPKDGRKLLLALFVLGPPGPRGASRGGPARSAGGTWKVLGTSSNQASCGATVRHWVQLLASPWSGQPTCLQHGQHPRGLCAR